MFFNWLGRYISRVGIAFSILFNTLCNGPSNQSFSARNWELKRNGRFNVVFLIDWVFFLDKDHCLTSWIYWVEIDAAKDNISNNYDRVKKIIQDEKNRLTSSRK